MAWIGPKTRCFECQKEYEPVFTAGVSASKGCPFCARTAAELAEEQHFAELDALSSDERIRRIEKWIYRYKPPMNIFDKKF